MLDQYIYDMLEDMDVIPAEELVRRLVRVSGLCMMAGGRLMSRQVVAMIVMQYELEGNVT